MADRKLDIILKATDQTQGAIRSASSGLSSLAKIAAGTALGFAGFQGATNLLKGLWDTTLGMNQSMDATRRSAVSMLDSIRSSAGDSAQVFAGSATQVANWGRQLRDIREREQDGMIRFADQTRELNQELEELLSGANIKKRARDEEEAIADLAQAHQDKLDDLNQQMLDAQNEGLIVDGVLFRQANDQKIKDTQTRIDKENREYQQQLNRRRREYDEDLSELKSANERRIEEVRKALDQEKSEQLRFVRDIKEAYADLAECKKIALSGGGGGGGLAAGSQAIITYREELQKLSKTSSQIFNEFEAFFTSEGIRSPFNIADIQRAGAQLIQFSGGTLTNMQKIVRMAESLASSPAVASFSAAERMDLAIRALSEAYNGQFTSMQRIFNISGAGFDKLQKGTFTTTQFTDGLNQSLEQSGINYGLVDQYAETLEGSWGNLVETGKLLLATISSPLYDLFRDELSRINGQIANNQQGMEAWSKSLKEKFADFIDREIRPRLDALITWFSSGQAKKDIDGWIDKVKGIADAFITVLNAGKGVVDFFSKKEQFISPGAARAGVKTVTKRAMGGIINPGELTLVGEQGPELIQAPAGSRVHTAQETRSALGSNQTYIFNNYGPIREPLDMQALMREFGFMTS